jgi:hypothetical protein
MAGFHKSLSRYCKIAITFWQIIPDGPMINRMLILRTPTFARISAGRWMRQLFAIAACVGTSVWAAEHPAAAHFRKDVQPILQEYCYDCHADGTKKGGVAFDEFKSDDALLAPDLWFKALTNSTAGLMPPANKPRPSAAEREVFERWIKYSAFGIDPKNPDPGRVTVRRLNRGEYRNTIRDLMGIDFNSDVEFPPDDTGYGFDNIGDVLTVSPMLLEKYLAAATDHRESGGAVG